jgi:hypothetical protein
MIINAPIITYLCVKFDKIITLKSVLFIAITSISGPAGTAALICFGFIVLIFSGIPEKMFGFLDNIVIWEKMEDEE